MSILDRFKLDGRVALVTGCRRGIGRAIARALAEAGADIAGVSASMEPSGSQIEEEVVAAGRRFEPYACDFADRGALYGFIERVRADFPRIDILVNNAGDAARQTAVDHTDANWDRIIEINLNAPFILAREIGRGMLQRGSGKIIFTASLLSFQGGIGVPSYAVSKSGIARLTMALANEWAAKGINVNALAPGYIATELTQPLQDDPVRGRELLARIPAGRWGQPEDLAAAAVFLASDASQYVHGAVLPVDGGWLGR